MATLPRAAAPATVRVRAKRRAVLIVVLISVAPWRGGRFLAAPRWEGRPHGSLEPGARNPQGSREPSGQKRPPGAVTTMQPMPPTLVISAWAWASSLLAARSLTWASASTTRAWEAVSLLVIWARRRAET